MQSARFKPPLSTHTPYKGSLDIWDFVPLILSNPACHNGTVAFVPAVFL
jgi:hypothetical protein